MGKSLLLIYSFLLVLALTACQRVIDINVGDASSLIVIEGNITNVTGVQTVTVGRSVPYDSANVYPAVSKATVVLGNGFSNYVMKESEPGRYMLPNFKGKVGQTYSLMVITADATYTARSVMPAVVQLDSLSISAISVGNKSVKTVSVYYHDPPKEENHTGLFYMLMVCRLKRYLHLMMNLPTAAW